MGLALLLFAAGLAAGSPPPRFAQLFLRTEPRMSTDVDSARGAAFELDLFPRALARLGGSRQTLSFAYGPRLTLPTDGTSFRHLHRGELGYDAALHRKLRLRLRQRVEVGTKDFLHPVALLGKGPDAGIAAFAERDTADGGEAEPAVEDAASEARGEIGPEESEPVGDAPARAARTIAGDDDDGLQDDLPTDPAIHWLFLQTELALELDATRTQRYGLTLGMRRSGALYAKERGHYPERLAPSLALDGLWRLSPKDRLHLGLLGELDLFTPGSEVGLGHADLAWLRALTSTTDLRLGVGLGLWHSTDPKAPYEVQLSPVGRVGLLQRFPLRRGQLALELSGSLAPYVSPLLGRTDPRVAGSAQLTFSSALGPYVAVTGNVSSRLLDWSPDGLQSLSSVAVGHRFRRVASIELGARALVRIVPHPPGRDAGEEDERFTLFAAVLLDTGPLF